MKEQTENAIVLRPEPLPYLSPVMSLPVALERLKQFQDFVQSYMEKGEDYGVIPGTNKPTLLKPGADKLCELYGLADTYEIISKVEDYDKGLFDYTFQCTLTDKRTGVVVTMGLGSCSSYESKYRYREAKRTCPACGQATIIKGKEEYGGGWICFKKTGGCGAKWADAAPEIMNQQVGRVLNPDVADQKNTILKIGKKRAKIDAAISATRSSGIFTQDLEDIPSSNREEETPIEMEVFKMSGVITEEYPFGNKGWFCHLHDPINGKKYRVHAAPGIDYSRLLVGFLVELEVRQHTPAESVTDKPYVSLVKVINVRKPEPIDPPKQANLTKQLEASLEDIPAVAEEKPAEDPMKDYFKAEVQAAQDKLEGAKKRGRPPKEPPPSPKPPGITLAQLHGMAAKAFPKSDAHAVLKKLAGQCGYEGESLKDLPEAIAKDMYNELDSYINGPF